MGNFGLDGGTLADLAFDPATGVLYGWRTGSAGDLYTVDLVTGTATLVGESGLTLQCGNALEFGPGGTLYLAGEGTQGVLRIIDKTTGLPTGSVALSGYPSDEKISALTFDGVALLGVTNGLHNLIRIDPGTGASRRSALQARPPAQEGCSPAIDGIAMRLGAPTTTTSSTTTTTSTTATTTTTHTTMSTTTTQTTTTTTRPVATTTTTTLPPGVARLCLRRPRLLPSDRRHGGPDGAAR